MKKLFSVIISALMILSLTACSLNYDFAFDSKEGKGQISIESGQAESGQAESGQTESGQAESGQTESDKEENIQGASDNNKQSIAYDTGDPWICSNILSNVEKYSDISLKDDFSMAVCSDWVKNNPILPGKSHQLFLTVFEKTLNDRLFGILNDDTYENNHDAELVQSLYQSFLDWDVRDELGGTPFKPYLEEIESFESIDDLYKYISDDKVDLATAISLGIEADFDDPGKYMLRIYSPNRFLKDTPDYEDLENMSEYTASVYDYKKSTVSMVLSKCGYDKERIDDIFDGAIEFEKAYSQYCYSLDEANLSETYSIMLGQVFTGDQMSKYEWFDSIKVFLEEKGVKVEPRFWLNEKMEYFDQLDNLLSEDNLEIIKDYLLAHSAYEARKMLDKECFYKCVDYENKLSGTTGYREEDEYAIESVEDDLDWPLSKLYCDKYVSAEDKQDIYNVITEILDAYKEMIQSEEFLSDATKAKAIKKLENIDIKCMYPDEWRDYSGLNLSNNYFENKMAIWQYETDKGCSKMNDPVDRAEWAMPPITINSFYAPGQNSFCILPGLVGDVLYNSEMKKEEVYGKVGVVISHEISHAFDAFGSKYDENGCVANWWADEDYKKYNEKTQKLVDYYNGIKVWDGLMCNGELIKGEACADMAGINCLLNIAKNTPDFDYDLFFRSYALIWAANMTPDFSSSIVKYDVHPINYLRGNVTVAQFDEFYETYDIKEGDGMYIAPEERVKIW